MTPQPFLDGPPPFAVSRPASQTLPLVVASPHSGRHYPAWFIARSRLGKAALRRSEDAFVDRLAGAAPALGAPLLTALWPRTFVDLNREPLELDPAMYATPLPGYANSRSPRVRSGLGTIPRLAASGAEIYDAPMPYGTARRRLRGLYFPYHRALRSLMRETRAAFGQALLLDCHSMPSQSAAGHNRAALGGFVRGADIVLGDCHGTSCSAAVTETAEVILREAGLRVTRNTPYAGGFTTKYYGRPGDGYEALQLEINRALYMDEKRFQPTAGMTAITELVARLIAALGRIRDLPVAAE